jgi:hypothetical protein
MGWEKKAKWKPEALYMSPRRYYVPGSLLIPFGRFLMGRLRYRDAQKSVLNNARTFCVTSAHANDSSIMMIKADWTHPQSQQKGLTNEDAFIET